MVLSSYGRNCIVAGPLECFERDFPHLSPVVKGMLYSALISFLSCNSRGSTCDFGVMLWVRNILSLAESMLAVLDRKSVV